MQVSEDSFLHGSQAGISFYEPAVTDYAAADNISSARPKAAGLCSGSRLSPWWSVSQGSTVAKPAHDVARQMPACNMARYHRGQTSMWHGKAATWPSQHTTWQGQALVRQGKLASWSSQRATWQDSSNNRSASDVPMDGHLCTMVSCATHEHTACSRFLGMSGTHTELLMSTPLKAPASIVVRAILLSKCLQSPGRVVLRSK